MGKKLRSRFELIKKETAPVKKKPKEKEPEPYNTAEVLRKRLEKAGKYSLNTTRGSFVCPTCGKKRVYFEKSIYIPGYTVLKCGECWNITEPMATRYELRKAYRDGKWSKASRPKPEHYDSEGLDNLLIGIAGQLVRDYNYWQEKADFWDDELKNVLDQIERWKEAKATTSKACWAAQKAYDQTIVKLDICADSLDESLNFALDRMDEREREAMHSEFSSWAFERPDLLVQEMRRANRRKNGEPKEKVRRICIRPQAKTL